MKYYRELFILCNIRTLLGLSDISTQELNMKWLNQPGEVVNATETGVEITVDPDTDYWRITHYGFIRDNGPFYYAEEEGDFEASVKVTGGDLSSNYISKSD